jgi:hypothetical protein
VSSPPSAPTGVLRPLVPAVLTALLGTALLAACIRAHPLAVPPPLQAGLSVGLVSVVAVVLALASRAETPPGDHPLPGVARDGRGRGGRAGRRRAASGQGPVAGGTARGGPGLRSRRRGPAADRPGP